MGPGPATFQLEDSRGPRRVGPEDFPLSLGGSGEDLQVVDGEGAGEDSGPFAYLGLSEGEVFLQRAEDSAMEVSINGRALTASRWLEAGDVVTAGGGRLEVRRHGDGLALSVTDSSPARRRTPVLVPPPRPDGRPSEETIQPVTFEPRAVPGEAAGRRRWISPTGFFVLFFLLLLGATAALVMTARSVEIAVLPEPDRQTLRGGLAVPLGKRVLLRPGRYTLEAEKAGYHPLEETFEVGPETGGVLRFALDLLPGKLEISTGGLEAQVLVDGRPVAETPLAQPLEVEAGEREIRLSAPRHQDFVTRLTIRGAGAVQTLEAKLEPRWAPVSFSSDPSGATVKVDGRPVGTTPLTADLGAGPHEVEVSMNGRETRRRRIRVEANRPLAVPPFTLPVPKGLLRLESEPPGATVTVDGKFRGETPLALDLDPGEPYEIRISKAGYRTASRSASVAPREERLERLELAPLLGEVLVEAWPPDAEVLIDGEPAGRGSQTLELPARAHSIEVKKEGYRSFERTVTPKPGLPQTLEARLASQEELKARAMPPVVATSEGQELRLLPAGKFRLGAPRREPGRRSNEIERPVELRRRVYLGVKEVSNRQFRRFRKGHLSGEAGGASLETDHHPVVRIRWEDAVAYCNWLSRAEGLPPAYVQQADQWILVEPVNTG